MLSKALLTTLVSSTCRRTATQQQRCVSSSVSVFAHAYGEADEHEYTTGKFRTGMSVKDSDVFRNRAHEYRISRRYVGPVKAVVLDWAGTVIDCGVYSPAVAFCEVFEREGLPISTEEARLPMGAHKKVHIRKITEIPAVRERWFHKFGKFPDESDVERMFKTFVPLQLATIARYTDMITGAVDVVEYLQKNRGIKIGSTTGFTTEMVNILKGSAAQQGYIPDCYVAADEVPQARPFPYMVWKNAIQLDVSPITAIVKVDDTADGVLEGVNAGCWSVGLARTGNYMGMSEKELAEFEKKDPVLYKRNLERSYGILSSAGAHYVIDSIAGLPRVIDDIERRLAQGEVP